MNQIQHQSPQCAPNTACTPSPAKCAGAMVVGLPLRGVRVFRQFAWLGDGSVKVALFRPAHQRVMQAVRRLRQSN